MDLRIFFKKERINRKKRGRNIRERRRDKKEEKKEEKEEFVLVQDPPSNSGDGLC